jgi:hypothetical protein
VYVGSVAQLSSWSMRVSVYLWPAVSARLTWAQVPALLHVLGSTVAVVPAVLSLSVAVAQSYATVSGQATLYQNDSFDDPAGAVNVCAMELSPLNGAVLPTCADQVPERAVVLTDAAPAAVQPLSVPVSKPPLVIPPGGGGVALTVRPIDALCVADVPLPVTVTGYVPAGVLDAVEMVSVELPAPVIDVGLKLAVVPLGKPLAESETVCAEPLVTAVVMADVPEAPCCIESDVGLALMEKSFAGGGGVPPQPGNLNAPMRECQLNSPVLARYSVVYQKVQSSTGSTPNIE